MENKPKKRGLANVSPEVRRRVASMGGNAHHEVRGLEGANEETRKRVASAGGKAAHLPSVIVNSKKKFLKPGTTLLSYEDVLMLAECVNEPGLYTVFYSTKNVGAELLPNDRIMVTKDLAFDVNYTEAA